MGLTSAEAARVGVLVEVQRQRTRVHMARVCAPGMAWAYLLPKTAGLTEERFGILCLNARGEVIADRILGMGTPLGLLVTPREVMREAGGPALYLGGYHAATLDKVLDKLEAAIAKSDTPSANYIPHIPGWYEQLYSGANVISLKRRSKLSSAILTCLLGSTCLMGQEPLDGRVNISKASYLMSQDAFRKLVMNKTAAEVKRLIGPPDYTNGNEGNDDWAYQHEVALNEATGRGSYAVLIFRNGRVARINFVG